MDNPTFFDDEMLAEKLEKLGRPTKFLDAVDWECFRPKLDEALACEPKAPGGRPPFDRVMMFKLIALQDMYNLSDDEMELAIVDRLSFRQFLGINTLVPDAKTIWVFRNRLSEAGAMEGIFNEYHELLAKMGLVVKKGVICDATFVHVPCQRNSREENEAIKEGKTPEKWTNPNKKRQKDMDARWTKKRGVSHFGYKNHIKADAETKIIDSYTVTDASVHDSVEIDKLVKEDDVRVWADSGYVGTEGRLPENVEKIICEKGYRNKPLTEEQKASNREKSKTRSRVEHIFGHFRTVMKRGMEIRGIGIKRARLRIGLKNLIYNMSRAAYLLKNPSAIGGETTTS